MQGRNPLVAVVSDAEEFGGAERYLVMLVESLREKCDFVGVVGDKAAPETERRLRDAGARISVVPGLRRRPTFRALAGLRRTLQGLTPDVVHVNATDQGDSLGPLALARRLQRPTVLTLHLVIPGRKRWRELISHWACRRTDAAIGVARVGAMDDTEGWAPLFGHLGTVDLGRDPIHLPVDVQNLRVFAGYAGWSEGQLDGELDAGGWFVVDAAPDDVFTSEPDRLWVSVLRRQGGRLAMFASAPPHPSLN